MDNTVSYWVTARCKWLDSARGISTTHERGVADARSHRGSM